MAWWWRDRSIRWALIAGFLLRLVPMAVWADKTCIRDECTYQLIADALVRGEGITGTMGWLWAPAFPTVLAMFQLLTGYPGAAQLLHLPAAAIMTVLLCALTRELVEPEVPGRATRGIAWWYALHPTFIFYASSLWSETLYAALLLGAMVALGYTRGAIRAPILDPEPGDRPLPDGWAGAGVGVLVGMCVLFRGVATYMLPIFVIGLLWGRWRDRGAWRAAGGCVLAAVLTVAPYSVHASLRYDAFIVSDRTLGQMMWMGNNEFPPMTFDYGNGLLKKPVYERVSVAGRLKCPMENPAHRDACEIEEGRRWIEAHPGEFLRRVPLRVAQMLNPHSFLTRHLRWGRWKGLPDAFDELLILGTVACSAVTMIGGTVGLYARLAGPRDPDPERARGSWYPAVAGLIVLYHVAAIAVTAGLSRYRVPLEPLWMVMAAGALLRPAESLAQIRADRWRVVGGGITLALLAWLMLWFLPAGWPAWGSWGILEPTRWEDIADRAPPGAGHGGGYEDGGEGGEGDAGGGEGGEGGR